MNVNNIFSLTRLAAFLLAAGLFISCASSKNGFEAFDESDNPEDALEKIKSEIKKQPGEPQLYYQLAVLNGRLAEENDEPAKSVYFSGLAEAVDSVRANGNKDPNIANRADSLIRAYWSEEYTAALNAYETGTDDGYKTAAAHAARAITLDKYETRGYKLLSTAQYKSGNPETAISTLNNAVMTLEDGSPLFEDLGYLYLEIGDAEQSAYYYNLANTNLSKNKNIAFGLVNAYIAAGNNDDALDLLNELAAQYPNDAFIHNVYGTQLFIKTNKLFEELKSAYVLENEYAAENLKSDIILDSDFAEDQLIKAYRLNTTNVEFIESLAVFYNNMAGNYFSLEKVAFEDDAEEIQNRALRLVDFAIDYYEKLSGLNVHNELYTAKIQRLRNLKESRTAK